MRQISVERIQGKLATRGEQHHFWLNQLGCRSAQKKPEENREIQSVHRAVGEAAEEKVLGGLVACYDARAPAMQSSK